MTTERSGQRGSGFSHVDATAMPEEFVQYLDNVAAQQDVQQRRHRSYVLLALRPGESVLDVGCGTGDVVRALAQMVGAVGRAVGIDSSNVMIVEAQKRSEGLDLPGEFQVSNVSHLDFPDHTFDGCRAERVFMHLDDPRHALAEIVRVAKPGARIVVLEADHDSHIIDAPDHEVTRKIVHFRNDQIRNGHVARQLYRLFQDAGLRDVVVTAEALVRTSFAAFDSVWGARGVAERAQQAGVVSAAEAVGWIRSLEEADRAGRFLAVTTVFLVSGRKS